MADPDDRLSRFMTEFGPQRDVESRRVLSELRQRLFERGAGVKVSRFEQLERIGHGGMGVVYRAWDPALKRQVAIKILHPKNADSGRVLSEARALAKLSHPNIVQVLDVGREGDELFIVMEYVGGRTLSDRLARGATLPELQPLLEQIADGLAAAHERGVIHHDIKPSNVLISEAGVVQIADFGLARLLQGDTPAVGGTRGFAAPEQVAGHASDARADVFSLTAIVHAVTYGRPPVLDGADGLRLPPRPAIPSRLQLFLRCGLAREPAQRFSDVQAWRDGLHRALRSPLRALAPGIASVAFVAALLGVSALAKPEPGPCESPDAESAPWTPDQRTTTQQRFEQTGLPYANDVFAELDSALSDKSRAWLEARTDACRTQDPAVLACTSATRAGLSETVTWLEHLESADVPRVVDVLRGLPDPSTCIEAAPKSLPPALGPFDDSLARAQAMLAAGRYLEARELLQSMPVPLETRRFADRLATHAYSFARALKFSGQYPAAATEFEKAYLLNLLAERDGTAAQAAGQLAALQASELAEPTAARRWIRNAHAALDRSTTPKPAVRGHVAQGIAAARYALGDLDDALLALESADAFLPADDPRRMDMGTILAAIRYQQGDAPAALEAQQEALESMKRGLGPRHPRLIGPMSNLGILYEEMGLTERAVAAFDSALALSEETLGPDHIQTAMTRISIAAIGLGRRDPEVCIALFERGLTDLEAALGPSHPKLNTGLQGLATALLDADRVAEAERVLLRALDIAKLDETLEPRIRAGIFTSYATTLRMLKRHDEALAAASTALSLVEENMGANHPHGILVRLELAQIYDAQAEPQRAREQLATSLDVARAAFGPEHPETVRIAGLLQDAPAPP